MSFSAFLTGTVLVSSLALGGLLAPRLPRHVAPMLAGAALVAAGFLGGWLLAR